MVIAAMAVTAALSASCSSGPRAAPALRPAPSYNELKMEELRGLERSDPPRVLEAIAALLGADGRSSAGPSDPELKSLAGRGPRSHRVGLRRGSRCQGLPYGCR